MPTLVISIFTKILDIFLVFGKITDFWVIVAFFKKTLFGAGFLYNYDIPIENDFSILNWKVPINVIKFMA